MGKISTMLNWRAIKRHTAQDILKMIDDQLSRISESTNLYNNGQRRALLELRNAITIHYSVDVDTPIRRWSDEKINNQR